MINVDYSVNIATLFTGLFVCVGWIVMVCFHVFQVHKQGSDIKDMKLLLVELCKEIAMIAVQNVKIDNVIARVDRHDVQIFELSHGEGMTLPLFPYGPFQPNTKK